MRCYSVSYSNKLVEKRKQMTSARNAFTIVMASAVFMVLAPSAWGQAIDIPSIVTGVHGPNTWMGVN